MIQIMWRQCKRFPNNHLRHREGNDLWIMWKIAVQWRKWAAEWKTTHWSFPWTAIRVSLVCMCGKQHFCCISWTCWYCLWAALCQIRSCHRCMCYLSLSHLLKPRCCTESRKENSPGGQRRNSVSCQRVTSCLWCSLEPILSSRLPPRSACSAPGDVQRNYLTRKWPPEQQVISAWLTLNNTHG